MRTILLSIRFLAFALFIFLPIKAFGETGSLGFGQKNNTQAMETDRPDFTEGTQTVQAGHLQIEAGYTYTKNSNQGEKSEAHALPELLLRVGLKDNLEFRLGWEGYLHESHNSKDSDGVSDLNVGFKYHIFEQEKYLPAFSFLFELGLPVGSNEFSADKPEPATGLLFAYDLTEKLAVGANFNIAALYADERVLEYSSSFALGYDLNEKFAFYIEYFGLYPESNAALIKEEHYLNSGLTWAYSDNLQFDTRIGFGLNNASDDFFTGLGFALKI